MECKGILGTHEFAHCSTGPIQIRTRKTIEIIGDRPRFLNHAAEIEDKLLQLVTRRVALESS